MAIRNSKDKVVLKLELDAGIVDEKQRVSTATYNNIRATVTDEELHATGTAISSLQTKNLLAIKRNEEMTLSQI